MKFNWTVDVLADLKAFARKNGLETLAGQLDDASRRTQAKIEASELADQTADPANNVYHLPTRAKASR